MPQLTRNGPGPAPPRLWRSRDYLCWLGADTGHLLGMSLYAFLLPLLA